MSVAIFDLSVSTRGPVGEEEPAYAEEKVGQACAAAPGRVLFARVTLVREGNPSLERPCVAKASVDVNGRIVRAHVAAPSMREAVDALEARLRSRLVRLAGRREERRREPGIASAGEWRHGDLPTHRPEFFPRPVDERRLIRRKTYGLRRLSPEEAASEMELLDHDFHLFTDAATGSESVVFRGAGGRPELQLLEGAGTSPTGLPQAPPSPTLALAEAIEELNLADSPFVFFRDSDTGRGAVAYRRYDGHYGLVLPAS